MSKNDQNQKISKLSDPTGFKVLFEKEEFDIILKAIKTVIGQKGIYAGMLAMVAKKYQIEWGQQKNLLSAHITIQEEEAIIIQTGLDLMLKFSSQNDADIGIIIKISETHQKLANGWSESQKKDNK